MKAFILSSLSIFLAIATLYGFPQLDEGICMQWAKAHYMGSQLYSEIPLVYGPLYIYLTEAIFSNFGFLHVTSRIATYVLAICVVLMMYLTLGSKQNDNKNVSLMVYAIWIISCSISLSESLHPGWFVSLLLASYAYFYLHFSEKKRAVALGAILGLFLGLKPHLALISLLVALFDVELARKAIVRFLLLSLIVIILGFLLQGEILRFNILYLLPYLFAFLLCCYENIICKKQGNSKEQINFKYIILSFVAVGTIIYLPEFLGTGFLNIKYQMLDLPSMRYHAMYVDQISLHTPGLYSVLITLFIIGIALKYRLNSFLGLLALVCFALVLRPNVFATYAFVLLHLLIYVYFRNKGKEDRMSLILLSLFQVFHLHPILGSQLYYSTPILFILLVEVLILCVDEVQIRKIPIRRVKLCTAGVYFILMFFALSLLWISPALRALLRGEIEIYNGPLNNGEFLLLSPDDNEKKYLINYLLTNLNGSDRIFTLPPYYSLNYLTGLRLPSDVAVPYYSYLAGNQRQETFLNLLNSEYVVIFPKSDRIKLEIEEKPFGNELYKAIMERYELVEPDKFRQLDWVRLYKKRV